MNTKNILTVVIASATLFTIVAFTDLQQKKEKKEDKGSHGQEQESDKGKGGKHKQDKNHARDDKSDDRDYKHGKTGDETGKKYKHGNKHEDKWNRDKASDDSYSYKAKKKYGNGNSSKMNGKRDRDIDWNLNEFENRKHPKNQKKVSICHKPGEGENNSVNINVSENALKAHMNHGDRMGNCAVNNSSRWSSDYVKARENVFNTYEQTWERMSYSEALLRLAANKLLGIKSNLDRTRLTLSNEELQRKEALILDLQNNINTLDNRLELAEKRLDSDVNIIIKL